MNEPAPPPANDQPPRTNVSLWLTLSLLALALAAGAWLITILLLRDTLG